VKKHHHVTSTFGGDIYSNI